MSTTLKHCVAAGVLACSAPMAQATACPDSPLWGHLGPPAFGPADCGLAPASPASPRDFELGLVSFYAGTRFMTADAEPAPFGYGAGALRRADRGFARPPTFSLDALGDWADAPPVPDVLALLLAGFLGIALAVRRRRQP